MESKIVFLTSETNGAGGVGFGCIGTYIAIICNPIASPIEPQIHGLLNGFIVKVDRSKPDLVINTLNISKTIDIVKFCVRA